jgi:hypothetical protein
MEFLIQFFPPSHHSIRQCISSSLHVLGESPVPASSVVVSLPIFFLVYLCLVFPMVDIYMPVAECGYVPFFADAFPFIPVFYYFPLKGQCILCS